MLPGCNGAHAKKIATAIAKRIAPATACADNRANPEKCLRGLELVNLRDLLNLRICKGARSDSF
jgi:hypothetical protein